MSTASLLAPKLKDLGPAATDELLDAARRQSKRTLEELLAARFPRPDVADSVRKVPRPRTPPPTSELLALVSPQTATPAATPEAGTRAVATSGPTDDEDRRPTSTGRGWTPTPTERVQPLAADRFKVQLTVSRATRDKLQAVQPL